MKIVSVCGSLGTESANRAAIRIAEAHLRTAEPTIQIADVPIADIPMLDPAKADDCPAEVSDMRSLVESADGVLLAAPEYAGGLAGGMKNALDWLVSSASIYHRPVAVLSAGTTGGPFAVCFRRRA